MDILHPLASLHWEEGTQLKVKMDTTQCVLVNDTLYVGGGKLSSGDHAQLFSSPIDLTSWSKMVTPTWSYGLTSYKSKVLLVGGRERKENGGRICNKLWAMTEPEKWESVLPSLPTKCHQPSAVGLKQCLIVAGGRDEDDQLLDKVEVLVDKQWSMIEPLPKPCCQMKSALHNGHCYFIGGQGQGRRVFYCNLSALLKKANSSICDKGDAIPLWSQFDTPLGYDSVASFGQELVLMGGIPFSRPYTSKVLVHSPHNQSLIEVARVPALLDNAATVVLSKREIVLVGRSRTGEESKGCQRVFKVTLQGRAIISKLQNMYYIADCIHGGLWSDCIHGGLWSDCIHGGLWSDCIHGGLWSMLIGFFTDSKIPRPWLYFMWPY